MKKKVLVLGGTGAMGKPLVEYLSKGDFDVYVTTRQKIESELIHYIQGNAHNDDFLNSLFKQKYDCVVDFMVWLKDEFNKILKIILPNTNQYIFISSARVYAPSKTKLTESSPRLLDACDDKKYLKTNEYALFKAEEENILVQNEHKNWTIIRPTLTYNNGRLQFCLGELEEWYFRATHNQSVIFPQDMENIKVPFTYGNDVAKAISLLVCNEKSLYQIIHVANEQSKTWKEIFNIYDDVFHSKTGKRIKIVSPKNSLKIAKKLGRFYQAKYARCVNREFDSSKLKAIIGEFEFTPMEDGLKKSLEEYIENHKEKNPSWKVQGYFDRLTKEQTQLKYFSSVKQKIAYLTEKYFPVFVDFACSLKRIVKGRQK